MSIFKGTLPKFVSSQLKARETIVSQFGDTGQKDKKGNPIFNSGVGSRDPKFLKYTTAKNGWAKMTSFVDYNQSNDLAKKYVLEGGTQYYNPSLQDFELRKGVGGNGSVYASDIDYNGLNSTTEGSRFRTYGYRPMPGVTSVVISNKGAYGSLRQATISYQCWDPHQLSELEKLFMRPGYSVLLEWGWSLYLDHPVTGVNIIPDPTQITIKNYQDLGIDIFNKSWTEDNLYDEIDKRVEKYRGNYDAMIGYITNFSWKIMANGGFECTTVLLSRGEALTSIKSSSNPYTLFDRSTPTNGAYLTNTIDNTGSIGTKPAIPLLRRILMNVRAFINKTNIYNAEGDFYTQFDPNVPPDAAVRESNSDEIAKIVDQNVNTLIATINNTQVAAVDSKGNIQYGSYSGLGFSFLDQTLLKPYYGSYDDSNTAFEYISLNDFIAILNAYFIPKDKNTKKPIFYLAIPAETPILACEDSVSVSPNILFLNTQAGFVTDLTDGFNPPFYDTTDTTRKNTLNPAGSIPWDNEYFLQAPNKEFLRKVGPSKKYKDGSKGDINVGLLGNIYINVSTIEAYIDKDQDILELLTSVLDEVQTALGNINELKIYSNKNIVQVIDARYLENGSKKDKFRFDLIGLKSICRNIDINSRVYSELSSMMAIAAAGDQQNLGDIYSTTQQWFNRGLKDRLIKSIIIADDVDPSRRGTIDPRINYYYDLYYQVNSLTNYIQRKVLGVKGMLPSEPPTMSTWRIVQAPAYDPEVINASSLLNTLLLQLDGREIDYKAVIPIELEITLDGIGGCVIGQIFTVDPSILPKMYEEANIGFIITGISHTIKNNDWVTTLKTQMCILDSYNIQDKLSPKDKNKLKTVLKAISTQVARNSYIVYAMADYLAYLTVAALNDPRPKINQYPEKNGKYFFPGSYGLKDVFDRSQIVSTGLATQTLAWEGPLSSTNANLPTVNNNMNTKTDFPALDFVVDNVIQNLNKHPFFFDGGDCYLKRWYDQIQVQHPGLPNFPPTYDDLLKAIDPTGIGPDIDLKPDIRKFDNFVLTGGGGINPNIVKAGDIFLYKILGNAPFDELHNNYKKLIDKPPYNIGNNTILTDADNRLEVYDLVTSRYAEAVNNWFKNTSGDANGPVNGKYININELFGDGVRISAEGGDIANPITEGGSIHWYQYKVTLPINTK
jgi:hypothetical protein